MNIFHSHIRSRALSIMLCSSHVAIFRLRLMCCSSKLCNSDIVEPELPGVMAGISS